MTSQDMAQSPGNNFRSTDERHGQGRRQEREPNTHTFFGKTYAKTSRTRKLHAEPVSHSGPSLLQGISVFASVWQKATGDVSRRASPAQNSAVLCGAGCDPTDWGWNAGKFTHTHTHRAKPEAKTEWEASRAASPGKHTEGQL